jgi:hypothetical protein
VPVRRGRVRPWAIFANFSRPAISSPQRVCFAPRLRSRCALVWNISLGVFDGRRCARPQPRRFRIVALPTVDRHPSKCKLHRDSSRCWPPPHHVTADRSASARWASRSWPRCSILSGMSARIPKARFGELVGKRSRAACEQLLAAAQLHNWHRTYGHRPTRSWPARRGRVRCCLRWTSFAHAHSSRLTRDHVPAGGGYIANIETVARQLATPRDRLRLRLAVTTHSPRVHARRIERHPHGLALAPSG